MAYVYVMPVETGARCFLSHLGLATALADAALVRTH